MERDQSQSQFSTKPDYFQILSRVFLSIYIAVTIPLRFAFIPEFDVDLHTYGAFVAIDLLCSLFFVYDSLLIFHRATRAQVTPSAKSDRSSSESSDSQEQQYLSKHEYRKHKRLLVMSIVSCLPLEYITLIPFSRIPAANYFIFNRIIRLYYLPSYIEEFSLLLEYKGIFRNIGIQRAWKLFFIMALAGHFCCCGFFFVAKMATMYGNHYTWVEELELIQFNGYGDFEMLVSVQEAYIQSLYWAYITMVSLLSACVHSKKSNVTNLIDPSIDNHRIRGYRTTLNDRNNMVYLYNVLGCDDYSLCNCQFATCSDKC